MDDFQADAIRIAICRLLLVYILCQEDQKPRLKMLHNYQ